MSSQDNAHKIIKSNFIILFTVNYISTLIVPSLWLPQTFYNFNFYRKF